MNLPLDSDLDFLCCSSTFISSIMKDFFFFNLKYGFMFLCIFFVLVFFVNYNLVWRM